jgi:hypothetical protein
MNKPPRCFGWTKIILFLGPLAWPLISPAADPAAQRPAKSITEDFSFSDRLEQYKRDLDSKLFAAWKKESAEIQGGAAATISGTIDEKGKTYDLTVTDGDPTSPAAKRALEVVQLSYLPPVPSALAEKLPNRRFKFILQIPLKTEIRVTE